MAEEFSLKGIVLRSNSEKVSIIQNICHQAQVTLAQSSPSISKRGQTFYASI